MTYANMAKDLEQIAEGVWSESQHTDNPMTWHQVIRKLYEKIE